ncbi:hypothetical protein G9F72_002030 [Clostridium estertheticum]|uniref:hypothetical protein n=1 Tax=Clostridium estertheticum TaxID=238834 RepID=UPI0013E8FB12|nr:hypothetical protein [Clostridium estertheticum]MBZ9685132.1 hypothetical protein [Clostridium estertheticum]
MRLFALTHEEVWKKLSKDIIDNVNNVIDKTIHHQSHIKGAGGKDLLVGRN